MRHKWTQEDRDFIAKNASEMKDAEIAAKLSESHGIKISRQTIAQQRVKLGIAKVAGRGVCRLQTKEIDDSSPF